MKQNMKRSVKRVIAGLLVGVMSVGLVFTHVPAIPAKAEEAGQRAAMEERASVPDATTSLNKTDWILCTDGKYRKIMDDFRGGLTTGIPVTLDVSGSENIAQKWYAPNGEATIKITSTQDGKLEFDRPAHSAGWPSIFYILNLDGYAVDEYEIRAVGKKTTQPGQGLRIRPASEPGNQRAGLVYDVTNGMADISPLGTTANVKGQKITEYSVPATANVAFNILYSFDGKNAQFEINSGPPAHKIYFDKLELIAVSDRNPDGASPKAELIMANDIMLPKNSGGFENWTTDINGRSIVEPVSPAAYNIEPTSGAMSALPIGSKTSITIPPGIVPGRDIAVTGQVEIESGGRYKNTNSAKLYPGSELSVKIERLKPNTEYTIFFTSKPAAGSKLDFRLSGFKDKTRYEYDNGNYNDGDGGKTWTAEERANMFNFLENLDIASTGGWADFRYDFTTGIKDGDASGVLARFNAIGGTVNLDEIYIVERSTIGELTEANKLPPNTELSRGHRILLDNGFPFQTWFPSTGGPSYDRVKDMGFTSLQFNDVPNYNADIAAAFANDNKDMKWSTAAGPKGKHVSVIAQDGREGRSGSPTDDEWENGWLTDKNGLSNIKNLTSMCMGDEEDYSDTLIQNLKNWFEVVRRNYDNADGRTTPILLHHNEVGNAPQGNLKDISTFNEDMLRKYVQTAKPDMITYDMYYFRERRVEQTVGGSVIGFYDDLNRYRKIAAEGLDGSGQQPIPFGQYNYSWRTGPGGGSIFKRGDGWYEMTESQMNLYSFGTWAFGGKWMSNFRWFDQNAWYLFNEDTPGADGVYKSYKFYDQFKEMIRQGKNLGPHLLRIQEEEVTIVPGQNKRSDGTIVTNNSPKGNPSWVGVKDTPMNKRVFIDDVKVKNLGTQNNSLNGDVFITYFNQLPNLKETDKTVFTSADPRYFTILNGLTAGDGLPVELQQGSAYETRQQVTITFKDVPAGAKLMKVSRVNQSEEGAVIEVPLVNGNQLVTNIGGGLADLYYWELGAKNTATVTTTITSEAGLENLMEGDPKYATTIDKKDMGGKTVIVGNIKGTDDLTPEGNLTKGINAPPADLNFVGSVLNLDDGPTPMGNITGIASRYFKQDIWEFRISAMEKDNNIDLEFKEYDWTKEQLIENVKRVKAGQKVPNMPDILIVPNNWMWEVNNLVSNEAVVPLDSLGSKVIDLTADKWNKTYSDMSKINGRSYGATNEFSENPIGMLTNKEPLAKLGANMIKPAEPTAGTQYIYTDQMNGNWTLDGMNKIITEAKKPAFQNSGVKLFVDNEYLIRQLMATFGVSTDPYKFDATSQEFQDMMTFYNDIKSNNLLLDSAATLDEQLQAFSQRKVVFMMAPYEDVAKHLSDSYQYYEDNIIRTRGPVAGWGIQTYGAPGPGVLNKDGKNAYTATIRQAPAGKYATDNTKWSFMLFPKKTAGESYKAIISNPSYPVVLSTTSNVTDTAMILNRLCTPYYGTNQTDIGRKLEDYPSGRSDAWNIANLNDNTAKDGNALAQTTLSGGYGDNLKASGLYDEVLKKAIMANNTDYTAINTEVKEYLAKLSDKDTTPVPPALETPGNGGGSGGGTIPGGGGINGETGTPAEPGTPETPDSPEFTVDTEEGIKNVVNAVNEAEAKSEIVITVKKDKVGIPKEVLNAAKGKDVTLKITQGDITIKINGKTIGALPAGVDVFNIKVTNINDKALSTVAKNKEITQIECAYNGKLPFTMEIIQNIGKKQSGKMLYYNYYNTSKKRLEYSSVSVVDKKGILEGAIKKGGKYTVTTTPGYVAKKITTISGTTNQNLGKNNKVQLTVKVSPTAYTVKPLQWKVSNSKYATVDSNGLVKAKKAGLGKTIKVSANALDGTGKKKVFTIKLSQK